MGGIFLFFACFMIDYCAQMWHNIEIHNGDGYFLKIE